MRKSGREHQVFNVDEMDYSVFRLDDGDMITIDAVLDRFENRVEVRGAVYRRFISTRRYSKYGETINKES